MKFRFLPKLAFLIAGITAGEVLSCQLEHSTPVMLNTETLMHYRFSPKVIPVGEHFSIDFLICQQGQETQLDQLKVDALMPAHAHGMNYRPEVFSGETGHYRVQGLLFHMPGHWQITLDVTIAGDRYKPVIDQYL